MDIFNKIGDTIFSTGKDVSKKAREISGITKLKMDIRMKEDFIEKQYAAIGKQYYATHKEEDVLSYDEMESISDALLEIENLKNKIMEMKGAKECSNCGEMVPEGAHFCNKCGAPVSEQKKADTYESDDVFEEETEQEVYEDYKEDDEA